MWIHTTLGYYSITQSPLQLGKFQIRARTRAHLENLARHLDEQIGPKCYLGGILETPRADYRWRVVINFARLQTVMGVLMERVDYSNFKAAAQRALPEDHAYHETLHRTWSTMAHLQDLEKEVAGG
ncbi:MAG: hypothetical protein WC326_08440 [Candidatus Delongbacteria bacterium]